jgi:hypothetical protein
MGSLRTEPTRRTRGSAYQGLLAAGIAFAAGVTSIDATASTHLVQDLRHLLIEALDAADGTSRGVLAGPPSEVLRRRGLSSEPLEVEVTTLKVYRQPGCKRLNVRFAQRAVKAGDAPPRDRAMAFQLNYCRDGQPPQSLE